jgi:hypothetical protein
LARYLAVRAARELRLGLTKKRAYQYAVDVLRGTPAGGVGPWAMKHSYGLVRRRWDRQTVFPELPIEYEPCPERSVEAIERAVKGLPERGAERAKRDRSMREKLAARYRFRQMKAKRI